MKKGNTNGAKAMKRFEDLLQRLFTVAKDDLEKAEEMADEIEQVIDRHEGPTLDE